MNYYLLYFSEKYNGNWDQIYEALKYHKIVPKEEIEKLKNRKWVNGENFFTILDEEYYPKTFSALKKPPFLMYYKGNINLLKLVKKIHITGNYETSYIDKYLEEIKSLPNDCIIINGNWKGIDKLIINVALNTNKKVILIAPCGINNNFFDKNLLEVNLDNLLIISEYPFDYHVSKKTLSARNRLMAALSNSLVLLASKDKILYPLIDSFLNLGKEVYCFSPESNDKINENINLINNGAELITSLDKPLHDNFLI